MGKQDAFVEWNSTARDYPLDQCLHQLVEQQVSRTPEAVAVVFGGQALSYRELNARANQLAHHLRSLGVGPDSLVGVCAERSVEMVVALLGTLKAGGAYVPLDPEYPKDRLAFMMQDADVPVLLTQERLAASLPAHGAKVLRLDADWERIARESAANPACVTRPDQLAYMIYTSGSTGKPKGAMNHHRGICNRLLWMQDEYRLGAADKVMQKTPFSFDVSVWEFFWPLLTGARLVLARPGGHRDPAYLASLIEEHGITVLHFVPSMLQIFLEQPGVERCASLRDVMCSGEALPYELQQKFFGRLRANLHNLYGPTEAAVDVTYWKCEREGSLRIVPIGRPVANTQCHILDPELKPVPVGEAGELHLGGVQVGYGYHRRPELTAEKFIPDPFASEAGARLYKTGDLARYLPDGAIEYLGRLDHQVKIRGFRIELGEIESCLRKQPGVHDCVVVAREDQPGQKRLVAYLVSASGNAPRVRELRASLQQELPDYMVPAAFVALEALPLSPNGKIDRKALPAPQPSRPALGEAYVAPRTAEETALAEIWSQVLEVQPVGIHDNYFELGGDSIRVIQMLARARAQGLHFTLEQVFQQQTIEKLAPCIRTVPAESSAAPRLQPFELVAPEDRPKLPADLEDAYPLAALQAGMHFHCALRPESAVFHDVFSYEILAAFDRAKLAAALEQLVARHAPLRTSFDFASYGEPLQLVHKEARVAFTVEELSPLTPEQQKERLAAWVAAEKKRPFAWNEAPLVRFHAQVYGEGRFQLFVSFHHIIFDGWSLAALVTQVLHDYFSMLNGTRPGVAPLRTSYREYVALERRAAASEEHRRFWRSKLAEPTLSSVPRWPASMRTGGAEQVRGPEIIVPAETLAGLRKLAQAAGVPLRTALLAAHMKVMSVLHGTADVISGVVTNGRQEELDAEHLVGLFLNTLPLRMTLAGGSWLDLCRQAFAAEQETIPYRRLPLVEAQKLAGGQRLFETSFDYVNWHVFRELEGHPNCRLKEGPYFEANDFALSTTFMLDTSSTVLEFHFDYDPEQLADEQVSHYCDYFLNTLAAMAAAPAARFETFSPLGEAERETLLVNWNQTTQAHPEKDLCLHRLFEARVARTPAAIAVEYEGQRLTYRALNARAGHLARHLQSRGVGPGSMVGICVERSLEMVVGILGILKAGAAYVPIDPGYPPQRIAYILEDVRSPVVLTQQRLRTQLPCDQSRMICLDADGPVAGVEAAPPASKAATARDIAYVIYTSGSTGRPKGVMVPHASICNHMHWMQRVYPLGESDAVLQKTPFGFDASVWEFFAPLLAGARLVMARPGGHLDPAYLVQAIVRHQVSILQLVPSQLRMLLAESTFSNCAPALRRLFCGGEPLTRELCDSLHATLPKVRLHNLYGPTEAAIDSTSWDCPPQGNPEVIPIGRPIDNARAYIVDRWMQPCPIGVPGELLIGGAGLARGYLNNPELTAERFIPDPFRAEPDARVYRTGDVARHLPEGDIEFLGRVDHQVKIRGYRIELGEIESALGQDPAIREVAVVAREDSPGDKRLVAYLVAKNPPVDLERLRASLRASMPEYMVPVHFVCLEALPLTSNGKVDRKALPAPSGASSTTREFEPPVGEIERTLARIWSEVLKIERVGRHDHFFELGGHSLLAVSVIERMRRQGLPADVRTLFTTPTLAALAAAAGRASGAVDVPPNRIAPDSQVITPEMLPLVQLRPQDVERIVNAVPGGAANVQDIYPLGPLQEGILFHHLMVSDGDPYLFVAMYAFDSRARLEAYSQALQAVIDRHDILRTAVLWDGISRPVQVVLRGAALVVEEVSLDPAAGDIAQQLRDRFDPRHHRIDLRQAPLLRLFVAHDAANARWVALQLSHHMVSDHTTLEVLHEEISAHMLGVAAQLPAPLPFRNFVAQARLGVSRDEHEAFFREMLGDVDEPTTPFGLTDVHGDGSGILEARRTVDAPLAERLRSRARTLGVSVASLCHLAWAQVLARLSGREDVVFGTLLFGRMQGGTGADRVLGPFINTLPIRIRVGDDSVQESVRRTHTLLAQLLRHEHAPLSLAQRCSAVAAPTPLFNALLNYRHSAPGNQAREAALRGWDGISILGFEERSNYPISLDVDDLGEGFALTAQVQQPVDPRRLCAYMHSALERLVDALENAPTRIPVRGVDVLPAPEHRQLVGEWSHTEREFPIEVPLHQVFEAQAARTPEAVAVVSGGQRVSYRELDRRANRLAHALRKRGVEPDVLVGLCVNRSADMIVAVLAVFKAGGAYVPLDPDYPAERLAFMLEDCQARVLITEEGLKASLPPLPPACEVIYLDRDAEALAAESEDAPPARASLSSLAYAIYTSGSTGRPKAALVAHRGLLNLAMSEISLYGIGERSRILQFASLSFDTSISEIAMALCSGGRLYVETRETILPGPDLEGYLEREQITVLSLTPSALAVVDAAAGPCLEQVIVGGEPCPAELAARWMGRCRFINTYGPTETTVTTTHIEYRDGALPPIIGRPLPNVRAYLLDSMLRPVPVGVPGELYIGGVGVARGYLNRPQLSAERFVPDPFCGTPAARMYRSGDFARWTADGRIEFIGRMDNQVKLRGFRIELGEIEAVLTRHPGVQSCAVILREDTPGEHRLVAYLVPRDASPTVSELRAHLKHTLPEHMVPAVFMAMKALPLTPNDKLDRKALPVPDLSRPALGATYAAPRTPAENEIAQIWCDVLGLDRVGIHDHFFEVGGDSILTIQVVARCRQAGLQITPRDLFKRPTIAQLAEVCAKPAADVPVSRQPLAGALQFTPIQRWFLEQEFVDPHYWNQAFLFELPADTDLGTLERALHEVLRHHDALRLRLRRVAGQWLQEYGADHAAPRIATIDLAGVDARQRPAAIAKHAVEAQASLDLANGPVVKAVRFSLGAREPGRLLLAIHHLAVDGVSWRLILEDLESAYFSLKKGQPPALPPKTTSYQTWAARLDALAKSAALERSAAWWLAEARKPVTEIPSARNSSENLAAQSRSVKSRLTGEETRLLLQHVPLAYRTQINDALLTALGRALQQWTGGEAFSIDMEGHGREDVSEDVDVSRTVGWFTTVFPVRLELPADWDEARALKSIKEQLRRVPDRGMSYGLLRYGAGDAQVRATLSQALQPAIQFNYLGQFDQVVAGSKLFRFAAESTGSWQSTRSRRTHALEVFCLVRAGQLEIEWIYHPDLHDSAAIERVAQTFVSSLRAIIAHCVSQGAGGRTPSDFPLAALTQETIDALWGRYPDLEDVYPLSPMQRLFYVMESTRASAESEPWHFRIDGAIDPALLRASIERVVRRHAILRTAFVSEGGADPLQIVLRQASLPWSEEDWRGVAPAEQESRLAALMQSERATAFDIASAPLLRVALLRTAEEQHHLIWNLHHLCVDGWSWPLLFAELSQTYEALRQGAEPALEPASAYRSYVAWLQEAPDSRGFWKDALAGIEKPTPLNLGHAASGPREGADRFAEETAQVAEDVTTALRSLARSQRVTLSTIVQGAWALLLGHYSGMQDVVFGAAFSGRPAEVHGIESLIGPCVTNVPVRVRLTPGESLSAWLASLQQQHGELWPHQHAPLEQIQASTQVPWRFRLFDSLVVFQNYQVDESARRIGRDARLVPVSAAEPTNYPLTVAVIPEADLRLRLVYQPHQFTADIVRTYAADLAMMLRAIAERPHEELAQLLSLLPASSRGRAAAVAAGATGTPSRAPVAPRTPTEQMVVGIFRELLEHPEVGVFESFFDLGGHSIAAVRLMSRLRAASGLDLPLRNLFERPTVAGLAEAIDALSWSSRAAMRGASNREQIEL